jgi:hypothetical protein
VDEHVAGADLVHRVVLPAQSRAGEDEEDLLLVGVHVLGHRPPAGLDPVPAERRARRARREAQPLSIAAQIAAIDRHPRLVVPVADHPAPMLVGRSLTLRPEPRAPIPGEPPA